MTFSAGSIAAPVKADRLAAAVGGICLRTALFHAGGKDLKAAGGGQMSVHIAVGEVYRLAAQFFTSQFQRLRLLQRLLARCIIDAQMGKFFLNRHKSSSF